MYTMEKIKYDIPNDISYEYQMATSDDPDKVDILIVSFSGTFPRGSLGNEHGEFISFMTSFGVQAFKPECLILDFRKLDYTWGNALLQVFSDVSHLRDCEDEEYGPPFPILAVTSKQNRKAFLSLVTPVGEGEPEWHFKDLDEAIKYGIRVGREWIEY